MAQPVITELSRNTEDAEWGRTPFNLSIKGTPEKRVTVSEYLNVDTGATEVRIIALMDGDKPVQSLSLLDYIARQIKPEARVKRSSKGVTNLVRVYA